MLAIDETVSFAAVQHTVQDLSQHHHAEFLSVIYYWLLNHGNKQRAVV